MVNQKLEESEFSQIEEIQNRFKAVEQQLGQTVLAEINLRKRREAIETFLVETQELEQKVVKELEEKYGRGSIDLQNKEFIPSDQEVEVVEPIEEA